MPSWRGILGNCAGMYDGGTTPSAAMIRMAREKLSIQLYVMIRPRGG